MLLANFKVERRDIVVQVDFFITAGEKLALFGPSGAGKTTVLETIAGLVNIDAGTIKLNDKVLANNNPVEDSPSTHPYHLSPYLRKIGLLRQDASLFPHMTVQANLNYARNIASRHHNNKQDSKVMELSKKLGIASFLEQKPAVLSGGQRHRVALGRLLLAEPSCLLLDEPFEGLDWPTRKDLAYLVQGEIAKRNIPAILVTHDLAEAQSFGNTLGIIDEGHILQIGASDEVFTKPTSRRVAELVGYRSFLPMTTPEISPNKKLVFGLHPARAVGQTLQINASTAVTNTKQHYIVPGPIIGGYVISRIPRLGGFEVIIATDTAKQLSQDPKIENITCYLPTWETPLEGQAINITVVNPPVFNEKGEFISSWENLSSQLSSNQDRFI